MTDMEEQEDELLVLTEICQNEFQRNSQNSGQIQITPDLDSKAIGVLYRGTQEMVVKHLPPITLTFDLPPDYPSKSPPNFDLKCVYIDQSTLDQFKHKLMSIWQVGEVVLYAWVNYIKENTLNLLELTESLLLDVTPLIHSENGVKYGFVNLWFASSEAGILRCWTKGTAANTRDFFFDKKSLNFDIKLVKRGLQVQFSVRETFSNETIGVACDISVLEESSKAKQLLGNLRNHHEHIEEEFFAHNLFPCGICFTTKAGSKSFRFAGTAC